MIVTSSVSLPSRISVALELDWPAETETSFSVPLLLPSLHVLSTKFVWVPSLKPKLTLLDRMLDAPLVSLWVPSFHLLDDSQTILCQGVA